MWPRKRLDITWIDLAAGQWACGFSWNRQRLASRLETAWISPETGLATLSVRSGLHLLLMNADWPAGSEILMSAMTIPDMARIVRQHGYVAVPVELDLETAAPTVASLEQATTTRTRAMIIAHLFGTRIPMQEILEFADRNELDVIEDCAQAYVGPEWTGTAGALASLFSFGTIKTATAIGGGLLTLGKKDLRRQLAESQATWPVQRREVYTRRIARSFVLKWLSQRSAFALFRLACRIFGQDYDTILNRSVRGFPGDDLVAQIEHTPSTPLLALMLRRLEQFRCGRLQRRIEVGQRLLAACGESVEILGHRGAQNSFWVVPVLASDPPALIETLRHAGFDATRGASMEIVAALPDREDTAPRIREAFDRIVYLPLYPDMPDREIDRLGTIVRGSGTA